MNALPRCRAGFLGLFWTAFAAAFPAELQAAHLAAGEVIMSGLARDVPVAGADSVPFIVASDADAQRLWTHQRALLDAARAALTEIAAHGMRIEPPSFELRTELRRLGERCSIEWVRAAGQDASAILIPSYTMATRG